MNVREWYGMGMGRVWDGYVNGTVLSRETYVHLMRYMHYICTLCKAHSVIKLLHPIM